MVRFAEEIIELQDHCQFKTEIDVYPKKYYDTCYMSVALYFSELDTTETKEIKEVDTGELKLVDTQIIQIANPENNLFTYFPLTFSDDYYSTAHIVIHSSIMDYAYRPSALVYSTKEDVVKVVVKSTSTVKEKHMTGEDFETVLFPAENAIDEVEGNYLRFLYNFFVRSLVNAVDELKGRILMLRKKFPWETKDLTKTHAAAVVKMDENGGNVLESQSTLAEEEVKEPLEDLEMRKWAAEAQCTSSTKALTSYVLKTICVYKNIILQLWNQQLDVLILVPHQTAAMLRDDFSRERVAFFDKFTRTSTTKVPEFPIFVERDVAAEHQNLVKSHRQTVLPKVMEGIENFPIKDKLLSNIDEIPIIFEDVFMREAFPQLEVRAGKSSGEDSLLVLVHGFEGSSYDVRLMRNVLLFRVPKLQTICSAANEGKTEGSIQEMGDRLAKEVMEYIADWFPEGPPSRISFIGHSLGGVIVRTALPKLVRYKDRMQTFVSFSTPHLGYMYQSSKLIGMGMWIFKKWKSSASLGELEMSDEKDIKKTFMYKLSKAEGLEWFKHVVLVSSYLDHYSPYESSRIEIGKEHANDTVYTKMAHNILSRIKANELHRVDVAFNIKKTSINSLIGREAHLQFLEHETLLKMIAYRYSSFFID
eukprot:TRINITY_DN1040_c0_g1_i9.p1 TRINITY_DN1040_c0_g1~~TRINITY_DN1040_c0_g1_i9.p1  ORF type:complete len:646 (-),score=185.78 TRINITY_DN1040_c0_g1_i9:77-2014(-)